MSKSLLICNIFFLVILPIAGWTQSTKSAKDLPSQIQTSKADTIRVKLLLELSRKILLKSGAQAKDVDSSYNLMKQAEQLSRSLKDVKGQGHSLIMAAMIANKKNDNKQGLVLAQQALSLFTKVNDLQDQAEAYIIIGQHYANDGKDLDQKIEYYKKAITIFKQTGAKERAATTLTDLGDLQSIKADYQEALKNLREALAIYQSIGYKDLQGVYDLLGTVLIYMGNIDSALKYQLQAINIAESRKDTTLQMCTIYNRFALSYYSLRKWNKAIVYYDKALVFARKYNDSISIAIVLRNKAMSYYRLNQPEKALPILKSLSNFPFFTKNKLETIELDYSFALVYISLKQYKMAKLYLDKMEPLKKDAGGQITEILRANILYYIATGQYANCYPYLKQNEEVLQTTKVLSFLSLNQLWWFKADSGMGKYQDAIKHYQRYKLLADSSFTIAKDKRVSLLQIEYDTEQKDKDLQLQSKNYQLLKNKSQLQQSQFKQARAFRNVMIGGSAMLLLLLGVGYNRYRLKQRSNLQLQHKQTEINEQNSTLQCLLTEKDLLLIEKDWLLKEVHHRVKNNLQIVMSLLNSQSAFLKNKAALTAIRESQNRVQAISLIHQKLYRTSNVASINMQAYIAELVNHLRDCFNTNERKIRFDQLIDPIDLDVAQAIPVGLILNETITNAIKYAFPSGKSGSITITLEYISTKLIRLKIADSGKGLPSDFDFNATDSLGMEMMKALSHQLAGDFNIENVHGAVVTIVFQQEGISNPAGNERMINFD